jgi:magnesium chelatase subunit D
LAAALRLAHTTLLRRWTATRASGSALVVLVSDGRANVALKDQGRDPHADALAAAHELRASRASALVVDSEDGPIRLGLARRLCVALGGQYVRLSDLLRPRGAPDPLAAAVRHAHAGTP